MTFGNNLDTLDRLRSSASVLNPGEGEASAGLGKGSVIPNFFWCMEVAPRRA